MSDSKNAIIDAAEKRMRLAGFNGFSFREIAADVGVKSSSVHYHFPTKEKLAAEVIRRYTDDVSDLIDEMFLKESDPIRLWTTAFRGTLHSEDRMCPCTVLGAGSHDLPEEVAKEVTEFFKMCIAKMIAQGLTSEAATELLATITGAQVISTAMRDNSAYDRAVAELLRVYDQGAASEPVAA